RLEGRFLGGQVGILLRMLRNDGVQRLLVRRVLVPGRRDVADLSALISRQLVEPGELISEASGRSAHQQRAERGGPTALVRLGGEHADSGQRDIDLKLQWLQLFLQRRRLRLVSAKL